MNFKSLSLLFVTALLISACSGVKLQKYPVEACADTPGEKTLSVIKDKCSLCHSGDFATRESICARKSMITNAVTEGRMPKIGSLTAEELKIIQNWKL